jgi:hypothetical protein
VGEVNNYRLGAYLGISTSVSFAYLAGATGDNIMWLAIVAMTYGLYCVDKLSEK